VRAVSSRDETHHRHQDEILESSIAPTRACAPTSGAAIFGLLAAAESRVHGGGVRQCTCTKFGQLDSILDVLGIAWPGLSGSATSDLCAAAVGHGTVKTKHGILRCPVPWCRRSRPASGAARCHSVSGETVTPTGSRLLRDMSSLCERARRGPHAWELAPDTAVWRATERHPGVRVCH